MEPTGEREASTGDEPGGLHEWPRVSEAPTRVTQALGIQEKINAGFVVVMASEDSLLHRAEMLLKDSMEFEWLHSELTDPEYVFLHIYTGTIRMLADAMGATMPFPSTIRTLQSASMTMTSVERKDETEPGYSPEMDNISFLPRKELTPIEKMCYDLVPLLLLYIQVSPAYANVTRNNVWRLATVEKAIRFLSTANTLLLKRGLGDRE